MKNNASKTQKVFLGREVGRRKEKKRWPHDRKKKKTSWWKTNVPVTKSYTFCSLRQLSPARTEAFQH